MALLQRWGDPCKLQGFHITFKCIILRKDYKTRTDATNGLTPSHHRPEKDETTEQFVAKISYSFERWIQLSRIGNTFDDLVDLMIREQFIVCCSKEMIAYLKEKECSSKQDILKWNKLYVQAHAQSHPR